MKEGRNGQSPIPALQSPHETDFPVGAALLFSGMLQLS